jgi:hypothetical protein
MSVNSYSTAHLTDLNSHTDVIRLLKEQYLCQVLFI